MNLYSAVNRVLKRLDDYPTPAGEREWPREEVELYVRDGYNAFTRRTKAVFDMFYPENLPTAGNYVAKWEENYFEVGWLATGLLNFTGGYWETDYSDHGGVGPVNHTVFWEDEYLEDTFQLSNDTVPEDNVTIERGTFNNIDLDPEYTRWYEEHDRNFQTVGGDPTSFAFDRDGIRGLRPVPAGTASATNVEIDGPYNPLKAYYTLDEASGTRLDSVGDYDLTDNNSVGSTTGKISSGASFVNTSSQSLTRTGQIDLDGELGITIECWIQVRTGAPASAVYFSTGATFISAVSLATAGAGDKYMYFSVNNNAGNTSSAGVVLAAFDTWYYVVGRYNPATGQPSISIDGGTSTLGTAIVGGHPVIDVGYGGGRVIVGGSSGTYARAYIDELAVWNKYRTDEEIAEQIALTRPPFSSPFGGFGLLRSADDEDGLGEWAPTCDWGGLREIPKHFPMGGQYGIPRRLYSDTANTRMEYFRLGKDPGQYQFEIPDRYVKYVEFYAQSKALERDGPGQDLALSGHFSQRFDEGVERTKRRLVEHKKSRVGVIGGSGRSQARPGLARLPYQYGRASRYR